jgi:hypothetical protein
MGKSIRVTTKKRRGRPATTGKGTQIGERWHESELATIDRWIASQAEQMTRGQAIRRLVEIGLKAHTPEPKAVEGLRRRVAGAAELATKALDIKTVGAADADERAGSRKRRLKAKGK